MPQGSCGHAGKSNMKKSTVRWTIILMVVIVGVVALYTFLLNRSSSNADKQKLSSAQLVLSRNLENDYPPSVKEVLKYYTEIEKCFYGFYDEECTDEELEALGMKARELYDDELLAANEVDTYLQKLKADINVFKVNKRRMTVANVGSSTSVDFFEEDGFQFARIYCGYTFLENRNYYNVGVKYLLRQDKNKRWKIYGWENEQVK